MAKPVNIIFESENRFFPADAEKTSLYAYFSLKGVKFELKQEKAPLNISLVVDRSGSMEGPKLDYVKKAVNFVIDNLTGSDKLSIVQYGSNVDVVAEAGWVKDKKDLKKKTEAIAARGMTNLSGGMLEGYAQTEKNQENGFVNRVLLLSDGLANEGITDPAGLQQIAQKKFREKGIALSSFGVGADFNEILMSNLAEYGGANYYFIASPEDIPGIFAKELQGLLSVIAQNAKLTVKVPEGFELEQTYGFLADNDGKGTIKINFNDVYSEEEKAVLFKFKAKQKPTKEIVVEAFFTYDDATNPGENVKEDLRINIGLSADAEAFKAGANHVVINNILLFSANEAFEKAMLAVDQHEFDKAKDILTAVLAYLDGQFTLILPNEEVKKQYQIIKEYVSQIDDMKKYDGQAFSVSQKTARSFNYEARKKK